MVQFAVTDAETPRLLVAGLAATAMPETATVLARAAAQAVRRTDFM
jgi:hypothetical protein